jgi:hypothetical protein
MRRARLTGLIGTALLLALVFAPTALAHGGGGQGWYGSADDQDIVDVMFIALAFFPTIIIIFSLIQWRLEKRKHARIDAAKARAANVDWRGGW